MLVDRDGIDVAVDGIFIFTFCYRAPILAVGYVAFLLPFCRGMVGGGAVHDGK